MIDGAAGVTVRCSGFTRRNHLHPTADGWHGRTAGERMSIFEQDAIMNIALACGGDFVQRFQGVAPLVRIGQRGVAAMRRARPDRAVLLLAITVAFNDRLRRALTVTFMKAGVEMAGEMSVEYVQPDDVIFSRVEMIVPRPVRC